MTPKILITGITGFVGSWLAEYIIENGLGEVYGTKRWRSPMDNIEHLKGITLYDCDLKDMGSVIRVLKRVKHAIEIARDNAEDDSEKTKAKNLLKKLGKVLWGQEKIKIILEDPTGNSAIISDKAVKEPMKNKKKK